MKKAKKEEMSFLEHLEELRWHIIRSLIAIILFAILAFVFKQIVVDTIILGPQSADFWTNRMLCKLGQATNIQALCKINAIEYQFTAIKMTEQFMAHLKISLIAGLIAGFPYIFLEFWSFIRPALRKNERRSANGAILVITFLFFLGVLFGYFIISPLSVNFLMTYELVDLVETKPRIMSYVSIVSSITLASGILFELPAIVLFLTRIGIVTPRLLKKYRKHALVVVLILSAIITPPDVFSQIMVSLPLLVLYEFSIVISKRIHRKQEEKLAG